MRIISSASVEGLAKHLRLEIGEFYRGLKRIPVIDALDLSEAAGTGMGRTAVELRASLNLNKEHIHTMRMDAKKNIITIVNMCARFTFVEIP